MKGTRMGSQHHGAVVKIASISKTTMTFQPGPTVCHWRLERCDVHRTIRLDGESILRFSLVEYQLFWLLVEHCTEHAREVSYQQIASRVFGYALDAELLLVIRKRICAIRKKV